METADLLNHVAIFSLVIVAIRLMFGASQAIVSATVGVVGGVYFQSAGLAYVLAGLVVPELLLAACVGWWIGSWIGDD